MIRAYLQVWDQREEIPVNELRFTVVRVPIPSIPRDADFRAVAAAIVEQEMQLLAFRVWFTLSAPFSKEQSK